MTPTRVQRIRKAGAKHPNTRYCGRGTQYGNRHYIVELKDCWIIYDYEDLSHQKHFITCYTIEDAHTKSVELYESDMKIWLEHNPKWLDVLLGFEHLSCFCPLHLACHVDAIIEHLKRREIELRTQ